MIEGLIIDCFAGGGGASQGIEEALGRPIDIAVNHDPEAIRMHKVNHPIKGQITISELLEDQTWQNRNTIPYQ